MLNLFSQAATTTESMMAKADRDEAERLNAKNSVEEYIYEIRYSMLLSDLHFGALNNLAFIPEAKFATSWRTSCWKETGRSSQGS